MRPHALAAVLSCALPASVSAGPGPRALTLEAGLSTPIRGGAPPAAAVALTASFWLEGPVEAVATVSSTDPGARGGRAAWSAGLRAGAGDRWRAFAEAAAGWASEGQGRATAGAGLGLGRREGPFTFGGRVFLRAGAGGARLELFLGAGGYF